MLPVLRRSSGTIVLLLLLSLRAHAASGPSFPQVFNTQEETQRLLSPQEALEALQLPEGFQATLFSAEPQIAQPIAIALDPRGRLWVAENNTYGDQSKRFEERLNDRIVILEDTNHDGRADKRTVFWDQAQHLTSLEIGFGGVWAIAPPHLLFIPDRDGDDIPDGEPEVILDGWSSYAGHNFVNGLRWGPDGWLYGRQGIGGNSRVGAPGSSDAERTAINGGMWRYHPITKRFLTVANGTTNPWGHDWNENGELFFINTVIGHLWHAIPGSHFQRMFGWDFNPYLYELTPQSADHFHWDTQEAWSETKKTGPSNSTSAAGGGHAHSGFMVYLGDNWPDQYRGKAFTVNLHGMRINQERLERAGATYVGRHEPDLIFSNDPWFRAVELIYGPDGAVYLADWSDIGECHENDGVHRTSGRIFKIAYGQPNPIRYPDLTQLNNRDLINLLTHKNEWFCRTSRRLLQERQHAGKLTSSDRSLLANHYQHAKETRDRLNLLWTRHTVGATPNKFLLSLLNDDDEAIRVAAIRLLTDAGFDTSIAQTLSDLGKRDPSGLVLTYLASSLQFTEPRFAWPIAESVALRHEYHDDRVLPLMLWYGIEPLVPLDPSRATQLAQASRNPKLTRFIARRLTEAFQEQPNAANALMTALKTTGFPAYRSATLKGIDQGLLGWRRVDPPKGWEPVAKLLSQDPDKQVRELAQRVAAVFGDGRALDDLKAIVRNEQASTIARGRALETLIQSQPDDLFELCSAVIGERTLAPLGIRGMAVVNNPKVPETLLKWYQHFRSDAKQEIINTLTSRPSYAVALLDSFAERATLKAAVTPVHRRQLLSLNHPAVKDRIAATWPEWLEESEKKDDLIATYRRELTPGQLTKADSKNGRELFAIACATCHTFRGQGGQIGPDLTGGDRGNLDYLLGNIVDPSATLADTFAMSTVELKDGRVLNGVIGNQTRQAFDLQTATEKRTIVQRDVAQIEASNISLMPEGLLEAMTEKQRRDLIAYLMEGAR